MQVGVWNLSFCHSIKCSFCSKFFFPNFREEEFYQSALSAIRTSKSAMRILIKIKIQYQRQRLEIFFQRHRRRPWIFPFRFLFLNNHRAFLFSKRNFHILEQLSVKSIRRKFPLASVYVKFIYSEKATKFCEIFP